MIKTGNKKWKKGLFVGIGALLLIGVAVFIYFQNLVHADTANLQADYEVDAIPFIKEFEKDHKMANKKYAEKIISVAGEVTKIEQVADTMLNIKMSDPGGNSYLIFAFQEQHMGEAKTIKPGDRVRIKGSCSDAIYSEILEGYSISFKRSTIDK